MPKPILQTTLREAPWRSPATGRLPGIQPLDPAEWLRRDEAFAQQMAERDRLISEAPDKVVGLQPGAENAVRELLELVLSALSDDPDYDVETAEVRRPDGVTVAIGDPLPTLGRLSQSDFCVLQKDAEAGWRLTAAVLCFPASWTLSEKIGRGLPAIHDPVRAYDPDLSRRVDRLFDAIRAGQPLWRVNALHYEDPALFQPRPEAAPRTPPKDPQYLRSERQTLRRLPDTGAVAFGIHTTVIRLSDVPTEDRRAALSASEQ